MVLISVGYRVIIVLPDWLISIRRLHVAIFQVKVVYLVMGILEFISKFVMILKGGFPAIGFVE